MSPEIVCLCGSTKFKDEYREANARLTLEGRIVLSVGFFHHSGDSPEGVADAVAEFEDSDEKADLDELHKRKIDMADRIHVINPGGYVGESTRTEIAHARATGTAVTWLESPSPNAANTGACWICSTGRDDEMKFSTALDAHYHEECLEAAGYGSLLEYEARRDAEHAVDWGAHE